MGGNAKINTMKKQTTLVVLHRADAPPCLGKERLLCRGCSGWEVMRAAVSPGGPWEGALIHCSCTGLVAKGPDKAPQR
ncbi:MAG: hypothetical protein KQI62_09330 [Deltaproteobacteria bacterium]|nr:hypothetical protein [Deltaproteobacteria bacterium]